MLLRGRFGELPKDLIRKLILSTRAGEETIANKEARRPRDSKSDAICHVEQDGLAGGVGPPALLPGGNVEARCFRRLHECRVVGSRANASKAGSARRHRWRRPLLCTHACGGFGERRRCIEYRAGSA